LARRSEQYHTKDTGFIGTVLQGLRVEDDALASLDHGHIAIIADLYASRAAELLQQYLREHYPK